LELNLRREVEQTETAAVAAVVLRLKVEQAVRPAAVEVRPVTQAAVVLVEQEWVLLRPLDIQAALVEVVS
jgi:hypothetical protein